MYITRLILRTLGVHQARQRQGMYITLLGEAKPSYIQYIIRQGQAELQILELTSVFHHLPSVGPKQLCALAHLGCTREAGTS